MPGNGRLHFKSISRRHGAWRADNKRDNSWFQVDFGRFVEVTIISTQGSEDAQCWVTKYRVTYSYDGEFFRYYKEEGYIKVLFPLKCYALFMVCNSSFFSRVLLYCRHA